MLNEQFNWSRHEDSIVRSNWGWVFWSQQDHETLDNCADFNPNVCAIPKVRDDIRHALQKLIVFPQLTECLVQFWAATKKLEGRTFLTTQYQPFALGITGYGFDRLTDYRIDRWRLCGYRMKICRNYNFFYADAESREEQLGLPGRVFLRKYPESTPDVSYYAEQQYPQLHDAIQCFIKGSWALPVFEYSSQTCVGVLEMVSVYSPASVWHDESFLHNMHNIFQEFGLICVNGYAHFMHCRDGNIKGRTSAFEELDMVLRSVCKIHRLPLAMSWDPCSASNDLLQGQLMSRVLGCANQKATYIDYPTAEFLKVANFSHLRMGGHFERVVSSPYMLYYSDITQFNIVEYPFAHYARWCNFSGCFTICLQSSFTEKEVYIVDFFLRTNSKDDENMPTTLSLILETMENSKTFKLASGQRLGEISLVEVMDFWNGKKLPFVQRIQAPRLAPSLKLLKDRRLMLQFGQLVQPSTDAIHDGMNVVSEERNYILPSLGALQDEEATMQLDSPHQPPLDSSNNGHNVVTAKENITVVTSLEEGKRKTQRKSKGTGVRIEVSLDDIRKCAGMTRKRAAEKLKVSESTFKLICRKHGIDRWSLRNMEKITVVTSLEEGKRKTQRKNKGTGVRIDVSLDDIRKCAGMTRKTAAEKLRVSESTLKRVCREHGIDQWPPRNMQNVSPFRPSPVEIQGQTRQLNSDEQSNQAVPGVAYMKPGVQDANRVTIRAKYEEKSRKTIKFHLSFSSRLVDFHQEVAKRLPLKTGTYYAEYEDEEGELIFIACDDDLQNCMHTARSQGNTSIEIQLKLGQPLISLVESMRRDPSLFEYIESESKTKVMHYAICHSKTPCCLNMLKSEVAKPICHSKYIMQFPEGIRNYIVNVKDVQADGNCGFRAIAALIGGDENEWKAIRGAMHAELRSNSSLYEKVLGEKGKTKELCDKLDYFGESPAPKDKWLTMPDMGHIVASAFSVVLVFLSDKQCLTFLPFYATTHPSLQCALEDRVCSMGLVNNDHSVQLYMRLGSPMPPIALNWQKNRQPHAEGWSAPFCSRIKEFGRIIGSDVATRETFGLFD